jgi:hypothetical protein
VIDKPKRRKRKRGERTIRAAAESDEVLAAMRELVQLVRSAEHAAGHGMRQARLNLDVQTVSGKQERWVITIERED